MIPRTFLLSPAFLGGKRGQLLLDPRSTFPLARRLDDPGGSPIGEVFSFVSGLYFRGKIAYAREFCRKSAGPSGVLVITPTRGMMPADAPVRRRMLAEFARVDINEHERRYRRPLERDAAALAAAAREDEVVLLGSVATGKYVDVLTEILGDRLLFPREFVGRGDMSRGGLMLRCVREGRELDYVPVRGAVRRGPRPPRLGPSA